MNEELQYKLNKRLRLSLDNQNEEELIAALDQGANPNLQWNCGWTALHMAVVRMTVVSVKELLDKGAHIETRIMGTNETPLHVASHRGMKKIADYLIKSRANVNAVDFMGETPLHLACRKNQFEIAKNLIANGSIVNAPDNYKITPFQIAWELSLKQDNDELMNLLRRNGASNEFLHNRKWGV